MFGLTAPRRRKREREAEAEAQCSHDWYDTGKFAKVEEMMKKYISEEQYKKFRFRGLSVYYGSKLLNLSDIFNPGARMWRRYGEGMFDIPSGEFEGRVCLLCGECRNIHKELMDRLQDALDARDLMLKRSAERHELADKIWEDCNG